MQYLHLAFIASITLGLLGCNSRDASIKKYQTNIEYSYSRYKDNKECKPSTSVVCLSGSEYKELCSLATSVTKWALQVRAVTESPNDRLVLENGTIDKIQINWSTSEGGKDYCYATISASGLVRGNSAKVEVQGIVKQFMKNDKGEILVTEFNFW